MFKILAATAAAAVLAVPSFAQTMTAADVGVQPVANLSAADFVKRAADADNFEIQTGRLAATKSRREDVKGFARQMVADHTATTKSLTAALSNGDRKITPPSTRLSSTNQAKLDLLKKAPKASFDQLYLQQQKDSHRTAWALNKGYADYGTDPALKQVAAAAVPHIEQHLSSVRGLTGGM